MPDVLYVGLQEDDKIVSFGIDAGSGKLVPSGETPAAGAPSVFALSPDRRVLYVGYRGTPAIESCRIDPASGALTSLGRVATEHWPTYLAPDRADRSPTLLLPSHARSRLFLRRAGVQRDGLPRRSRHGHPRRRGNDALAARRCDRAQYLFADLSDTIGPVPLCRQPRPQQHRRVRRRPGA